MRKPSAYDIPYAGTVDLSAAQKREAIQWWQRGEVYPPLTCPVCGNTLTLAVREIAVECPTIWCSYATDEIPWAIYAAFRRHTGANS